MASGPPPGKKPRTTFQQAGRLAQGIFRIPPSQPPPPNPPGPSSEPTQNHPNATQPVQPEGILQSAKSPAGPRRGVKRAAGAAWSRLENALRTLQQSSDMFPLVKSAVNPLAGSRGRKEYDELASNLAIILTDLAKHLRESRSGQMSDCVLSLIRGIEQQIDSIKPQKDRLGPQRFLEAQQDLDGLSECRRRIEMLFQQLQNNAVLSVWSIVNEQLANTRLESMQPVKNAHYDSAMAAVVRRRQCTPNTRQAVLEDLRVWKDNPNGAKVYWMNGMAGTGKTTIASTLCSELEVTRQLAASFFCSRELPDCRDATRIIPTISYQLARFSLPFQSALCETLGDDPDASTRSVGVQFEKLIKEPLLRAKDAIQDGVVVVIDALDECRENVSVQSFLRALCKSVANLPIKFFITCRPEQSILTDLLSWNQASRALFHLHDIEQSVVQGDIETYLNDELEGLPMDQIHQLAERSGKLFIFAATVVRYVKPSEASVIRNERLKNILGMTWSSGNKAYGSIDTLYSTILAAALSHDELEPSEVKMIKRVLHTVICVKEPMTIQAMACLLDIVADEVERAVDQLRSVLHVAEGTSLVSMLHASFPDYMLNQERSKDFFCDAATHHHLLALRCFDVMKKLLRFNICNLESSYVLDEDVLGLPARIDNAISPHLFYTCSRWADHLCEAGTEEGLMVPLDSFLSNGVLFWLEVLNLKECVNVGIVALAKVRRWLQERNAPSAVCRIAQDASKFTTMIAANAVRDSTPHIYVSVLALWSREDPMWVTYGTRMRGLVQLEAALHSSKSSALLATWDNGDKVMSIAASLDGSRVVSTSEKGFIVWDAYTGNQISSPLNGHTKEAFSVAISPNGHIVASGSSDCTVYIWDAKTADRIAGPFEGHTKPVYSVAFSPDGARIASGSKDCTIRIWDTRTGHLLKLLEGHAGPVNSVVFSPDGGCVVSGSRDCTTRVWDARTGHMLISPFKRRAGGVNSVAFSPDGARIACDSDDRTICIWGAQNGNLLASLRHEHTGYAASVMFSFDGARIVSGSYDGTISIWDAYSGSVLAGPFRAHFGAISSVVFSPDGNRVISGSAFVDDNERMDYSIRIWDVNAGSLLDSEPDIDISVELVAISPDHSSTASVSNTGYFHIWNLHTGDMLTMLDTSFAPVNSIAFAPDGARVALGLSDGDIGIGDAENGIWEEEDGEPLLYLFRGHTSAVTSLTFSPDGERIASGSNDCTIRLWNVHTSNTRPRLLKGHTKSVRSVVFSPDGARVASGSDDCTIRIWGTQSGHALSLLEGDDPIRSVAFSPDGQHVSGSEGCIACVWDVETGNMLARSSVGDIGSVYSVALSPDGRRIVSGSGDGIRIWDAWTGLTLAGPFKAHTYGVDTVAFSPDGSHVVSGSFDGRVFVWELHERDYDVTNSAGGWTLDEDDGWIVGRNSARLLWLPPAMRTLPKGKPIVVHDHGPFGIDFDTAAVGTRWATCFSG